MKAVHLNENNESVFRRQQAVKELVRLRVRM